MSEPHTLSQYVRKSVARGAMGAMIAPLARWSPMESPEPGYTLLIGCNRKLGPMLLANLRLLARQKRENLKEVILAIDGTREELGAQIESRASEVAPGLPIRFVHYTPAQIRVTRMIDWGWVYAWLSWCVGISRCRTRYAMLHDFDALLLNPDVLEHRYREIQSRKVEYLGIGYHAGGGVSPEDKLVRTFELMFDAQFVRSRFRPIQLFNTMRTVKGRKVEFDTFLNAQHLAGTTDVIPLPEEEMVHPSQMICQFVDFTVGRGRVPPSNNLLMIPYYEHIGGDSTLMLDVTRQLRSGNPLVSMWGRQLDVRGLVVPHRAWIRKQALRMESSLHASPDSATLAYLDAIDAAPTSA